MYSRNSRNSCTQHNIGAKTTIHLYRCPDGNVSFMQQQHRRQPHKSENDKVICELRDDNNVWKWLLISEQTREAIAIHFHLYLILWNFRFCLFFLCRCFCYRCCWRVSLVVCISPFAFHHPLTVSILTHITSHHSSSVGWLFVCLFIILTLVHHTHNAVHVICHFPDGADDEREFTRISTRRRIA